MPETVLVQDESDWWAEDAERFNKMAELLAPHAVGVCLTTPPLNPDGSLASLTTHGGPGSGNFGHEGRPGQVGGSGAGGGDGKGEQTQERPPFLSKDEYKQLDLEDRSAKAVSHCERIVSDVLSEEIEIEQNWDSLSDGEKSEAESQWINDNISQFAEGPYEEWQDSLKSDIENDLAYDDDFGKETWEKFAEANKDELKLTPDEIEHAYLKTRQGEIFLDFTDTDYFPDGEERLTEQNYRDLNDYHVERMERETENRMSNAEFHHFILEQAYVNASKAWQQMSDSDKFDSTGKSSTITVDEPNHYKAFKNGHDYLNTRGVARAVQTRMTVETAKERGLEISDEQSNKIASHLWDQWKGSSTSGSGLLLQEAASQELGGLKQEFTDSQKEDIDRAANELAVVSGFHGSMSLSGGSTREERIAIGMTLARSHVYSTWATSQYVMKKAGIKDVVTYRAIILPREQVDQQRVEVVTNPTSAVQSSGFQRLPDLQVSRNGAASTAIDRSIANNWNGVGVKLASGAVNQRVVLRINTPREAVLSIPVFGQNVHEEQEVVVVGTTWNKWDAFKGEAPSHEYIPIK